MSLTENTKIVQQCYEQFKSGDIEGMLAKLDDNVKWMIPAIENAPFAGSRTGREKVAEFFGQLNEAEEMTRFEPLEFVAQDDKVVVLGESAAKVTSTGRSFETEWVHVFHLRHGKIASFQEFFDNAAATRAYQKASTA